METIMTAVDWTSMPSKIATLPRDARGYPIPYIVLRAADGTAILGANDHRLVERTIKLRLCHVCGQPLGRSVWFVGGPASAFLNAGHGAWGDGPLHETCLRYSMRVCPYLAHRTVKPMNENTTRRVEIAGAVVLPEIPSIGGMPSLFVAVKVKRWRVEAGPVFVASKPYDDIAYWREGRSLTARGGAAAAADAIRVIVEGLRQET